MTIPEEAREQLIKNKQMGMTWTALARWLDESYGVQVHRTTVQRWFDREVYTVELDDEVEFTSEDRLKLDKKVAAFKAEASHWKKLYGTAVKKSAQSEAVIDAVQNLLPAMSAVPVQPPHVDSVTTTPQTVIAPLTDTHVGDRVESDQMVGLNEYSIDIFNRRLYGWHTQLLQLVELRRKFAPINKLIVPMLGDMISGDIHEELARTNIDNCMGQMIRGANMIAQALMGLSAHFTEIEVPCVVGNHGRMTRKPPMKDKFMDWDYMLYQWVATLCREQTNIKFDIPKSFVNSFDVDGRKILIMHGDSVSGAGSATSIVNSITKMRSVFQYKRLMDLETGNGGNIPPHFDSVFMGHFHRVDESDIGTGEVHICGTMKGGDEFALQRLAVITRPKQIATYWHPQYGCVGKEIIYLNRYDTDGEMFNDEINEIWSNSLV